MDASKLPRWRGFNLLEKFTADCNAPFVEADFDWIAEWGFDFVRLPLSYRCWCEAPGGRDMDEAVLAEIDRAVEMGRARGIHVSLCFHRAPGYCVNDRQQEPFDLWRDGEAVEVCAHHWAQFARRYKGIGSEQLSFDLVNEPGNVSEETYLRVASALVEAIRVEDPGRLIIADGWWWGKKPMHSLVALGIAQSTRGYDPNPLSHYRAKWAPGWQWYPRPTWPLVLDTDNVWDRARLEAEFIEPWKALERAGSGVHVGEWGAYKHTPHTAALAWMRDWLELWRQAGWGWALWNLRGPFGILDSERKDVAYENFRGHALDRKMLELLRTH